VNSAVPVPGDWTTRGELLAARAEAVPALEDRLLSLRRLAGQSVLFLATAFAGALAGSVLREVSGGTLAAAVVLGALAAAAAAVIVRAAVVSHRWYADLLRWEQAEHAGRALPPGRLAPEHRAPFDARDDDDFEQLAALSTAAAHVRPFRTALLLRGLVAGLGLGVGMLYVLMATLAIDGDEQRPLQLALLVVGAFALAAAGAMGAAATRYAYRLTRASARLEADVREARAARAPDAARDADLTAQGRRRGLLLALVASPLVLLLGARLAYASTTAVLVYAAVLVVGGVVAVGIAAARRGDSAAARRSGTA
jgi:hypothetical protein